MWRFILLIIGQSDFLISPGHINTTNESLRRQRPRPASPELTWYLDADLDRLPVSALGVRDALGVVAAVINHRLVVSALLLQGEDDSSDVHVAARKQTRTGQNLT